jgi:hypothetical protein
MVRTGLLSNPLNPGTKRQTQTPNTKHQTPNIKHQTPNIKHQTLNTKHQHQTPNTKHPRVRLVISIVGLGGQLFVGSPESQTCHVCAPPPRAGGCPDGLPDYSTWGDWCATEARDINRVETGPPLAAFNFILSMDAMAGDDSFTLHWQAKCRAAVVHAPMHALMHVQFIIWYSRDDMLELACENSTR